MPRVAIDALRDDELPPELFFSFLCGNLIRAIDVSHLVPDHRGQCVVEYPRPLQCRLQVDALPDQVDDPSAMVHERLHMLDLVGWACRCARETARPVRRPRSSPAVAATAATLA